jgi:hypothetical protein
MVMSYSRVLYSDIYDPLGNPAHAGTRHVVKWDTLDDGSRICYEKYNHYEGYGQGYCREKMDFLESINLDHPLWSLVRCGESGNKVGEKGESVEKSLMFNEEMEVRVVGGNDTITEKIDGSDRTDRISWNFSLMLAEYVEKCSISDRPSFFKGGGWGMKWANDMDMMKNFKGTFDSVDDMLESDKNKTISLSDQSVKNYPRNYYNQISVMYKTYMEEKLGSRWWISGDGSIEEEKGKSSFKFNPDARVFVPEVILSPGVGQVSPPKPRGPAPVKTRPQSTDEPDHLLPWRICEESDKKIIELDRKLQVLINLHGPVVCAQQI